MPASVGCFWLVEGNRGPIGPALQVAPRSSACKLVARIPSRLPISTCMRPARRTLHVSSRLFAMLVKDEEWDRSQTVSFSFLFDLHDDLFWSFLVCCSQCSMTHCS
eukprot:m.71306 g.71306  ORF g.71306 m.71306 type:complete len:106 (-) comp50175_c0_seq2:155-472(-)